MLAAGLIATLVVVPAPTAAAQTAQGCQAGEVPHFTFGFADLKAHIGGPMGDPVTCEFADPNGTGDVHQRTTTGLAFWRKSTNTPTFTNGFDHWAETPQGWVTWTGASVDPPLATAYPEAVVQQYLSGCEQFAPDNPQLQAYCGCTIRELQAIYPLSDFLNLGLALLDQGALPPEFTAVVEKCASLLLD